MIIKNANNNSNKSYVSSEIGRQMYEQSVLTRMEGRAGAYTQTGSKGIAHEIIANDLKNLKQPGTITKCTANSTATQLDAVTMKGGKVIERIQYKDTISPNGLKKTVDQMASGKYRQATMYGTKETAEMVNAKCAAKGISKQMHSTGISSETTARIGDKFLGNMPTASSLKNVATSSAAFAGGISAGVEVIKSIANGDSAGECANHVVTKGAENMVSAAVGSVAAEAALGVATTFIALPAAPLVIGATAVGLVTSVVANEVIEGAFDEVGDFAEEVVDNVSYIVEDVVDTVSSVAEDIVDGIFDFFYLF